MWKPRNLYTAIRMSTNVLHNFIQICFQFWIHYSCDVTDRIAVSKLADRIKDKIILVSALVGIMPNHPFKKQTAGEINVFSPLYKLSCHIWNNKILELYCWSGAKCEHRTILRRSSLFIVLLRLYIRKWGQVLTMIMQILHIVSKRIQV